MIQKSTVKILKLVVLFSIIVLNTFNVYAESSITVIPDASVIVQIINFFLLVGGIFIFPIIALFSLRKRKLSGLASALWTLIILLIPFFGMLSYFIVNPQDRSTNTENITNGSN